MKSKKSKQKQAVTLKIAVLTGEKDAVLYWLTDDYGCWNVEAMFSCVLNNITDQDCVEVIKELKNSKACGFGIDVAQAAVATLDILGIEKYEGNNKLIKSYISSKFDFYRKYVNEAHRIAAGE